MRISRASRAYLFVAAVLTSAVSTAFVPVAPTKRTVTSGSRLYYDIQRDPPNENVWSVLANTERWIATTLSDAQRENGNPLSRKEVSYVCETSQDPAMILANIFRKLKEARQLGETHAQEQEELVDELPQGGKPKRATLRQTQVLVIPSNEELNDFHVFDRLVEAINTARRSARDYVTDHSLEKLDDRMYGEGDRDWIVSVNCAHLHPKFGERTPQQQLKDLQEEDDEGEIDLNLQEYKERRLQARRSPYPSVVVEVRSVPPPDFTPPPPSGPEKPKSVEVDDSKVEINSEFVQQLEALFSKSSLHKDGGFYESIGTHIETFSSVTPLMVAQNWISQKDPLFDVTKCAFTVSDTMHVDEAYEFVFTNLAMQTSQFLSESEAGAQKRQYMVMPHFLSSSATSMEKFAIQTVNIIQTLPTVRSKVELTCLHPEHIEEDKRCPVPVFVLQWRE